MQTINIDDIIIEKPIILVDTKNPNNIISAYQSGKMPLDKLRVYAMIHKLKSGKLLPPISLNSKNELIDGHHRYMAHKIANINDVPFKAV